MKNNMMLWVLGGLMVVFFLTRDSTAQIIPSVTQSSGGLNPLQKWVLDTGIASKIEQNPDGSVRVFPSNTVPGSYWDASGFNCPAGYVRYGWNTCVEA